MAARPPAARTHPADPATDTAETSQDPPPHLTLLGGFALRQGGDTLATPPVSQRVLAYLAVQEGTVPRATAAHTLWPDADDDRAAASLRSALWRLPHPPSGPLVEHPAGALGLTPGLTVDTHRLERQTAALGGEQPVAPDDVPEPHLLRQELLPGWEDEWLVAAREWLRQVRLRGLERLCAHHRREGRTDLALEAGMAAVASEPLRESAHRMVVAVHIADGNGAEALRQYDRYRELLRDELGVAPSSKFRHLLAPLLGRPLDGDT